MPMGFVAVNTIPIVLTAALIAFGLWRAPDAMTKGFLAFGKGLVFVISIGLVIGVFETVTGVKIMPAGWELLPVADGIAIVGSIAMMLLGAFPAVHLIVTFGAKPLSALGKLVGVNKSAAGGLIATLANNIAMFEIFKNMDRRGKILNAAFAVSAAFALGDHLGFTAGVAPDMIAPMIAGKLVAGITAVALAFLLFAKTNPPATSDDDVVAEAEAGE